MANVSHYPLSSGRVIKEDGSYVNYADGIEQDGTQRVKINGTVLKDVFSGATNVTKTFSTPMRAFEISNDGTENLTYTINGLTMEVKVDEIDSNHFEAFTQVTVNATSTFRARVYQ